MTIEKHLKTLTNGKQTHTWADFHSPEREQQQKGSQNGETRIRHLMGLFAPFPSLAVVPARGGS
jgi:hypothetical protein